LCSRTCSFSPLIFWCVLFNFGLALALFLLGLLDLPIHAVQLAVLEFMALANLLHFQHSLLVILVGA
jgi:hypothetical protein